MAAAEQPLYFGPADARLFGWLHRPVAHPRGVGLVVCNPFGFEEVCAHRSLAHFASNAADAGLPTLRFDYAGCGNSAGDEFGPDPVGAWVRSVHEAVDTLKQASGVSRVVLLGVRLGAALATLAAVERDDVAGIVAIAPVVRGRGYLRELTMLSVTGVGNASGAASSDAGLLESAGFVLTRAACDALGAVDLRNIPRPPAPQVLIVERDDVTSADTWSQPLRQLGAEVTVESWKGYAGMMSDPQRAVVPQAMIDGVVSWLRRVGAAAPSARAPQSVGSASMANAGLRETAVHVHAGETSLVGILTTREPASAGAPAVLMLNSGSVHLIGPNRLWVRLARQWAARGITVLRIDLSGIGDSPPRPGAQENVVYSAHAGQDIAGALTWLRAHGAGACHVVGLCSGAYHALKAAVAGQALESTLMINPLTYFWKEGMQLSDVKDYEVFELTSKFRGKFFTRGPWLKLLSGRLDLRLVTEVALRRVWNAVTPVLTEAARLLHVPMRNDLVAELNAAAQRGIRLRFVFAAHAPGFTLLRKETGRAMRRFVDRRHASIDFVAGADHTFTRLEARERLVATLDRLILDATQRS
jgi:pimeloyl-ACP methyl ester carboxylesterase